MTFDATKTTKPIQGVVLRYAIQSKKGPSPDFILCMGDDASDEYMFTSIYSYLSETAETELHRQPDSGAVKEEAEEEVTKYVFTCSVGKHRSHASFYVRNVDEIRELLETLAGT